MRSVAHRLRATQQLAQTVQVDGQRPQRRVAIQIGPERIGHLRLGQFACTMHRQVLEEFEQSRRPFAPEAQRLAVDTNLETAQREHPHALGLRVVVGDVGRAMQGLHDPAHELRIHAQAAGFRAQTCDRAWAPTGQRAALVFAAA